MYSGKTFNLAYSIIFGHTILCCKYKMTQYLFKRIFIAQICILNVPMHMQLHFLGVRANKLSQIGIHLHTSRLASICLVIFFMCDIDILENGPSSKMSMCII